jgi:starch phosphorylase
MLGMGGVLALQAMGIQPTVYHMNEGHSAFLTLQRIKDLVLHEGLSFDQSIETVKAGSHFTTHTPVPAGNDMFDPALIERYFNGYCQKTGISLNHLLELGRQDPSDTREPFCMTVLALRLSSNANGVSKLHGEVARSMWQKTWSNIPQHEVPIQSVTNGVHIRYWISRDLGSLYDRYLGPGWVDSPDDLSIWERIDEVPGTELWRIHERRRERLVAFVRTRLNAQLKHERAPAIDQRQAWEVLDSETLTIGFARRFATYKRAGLLLSDPERLKRILLNPERPVQLIIAGKAHPADNQAKEIIRQLVHFARDPEVRNHMVFVENYDMNVARYMVQGVDCWLNNPRRPMEASGTSGMKAAANGALNISIPDGWWCEAEELGDNGWSIGKGEQYENTEEQDAIESAALYELLEKEVVPLFYQRGRDRLPREWIQHMKNAIRTICPMFNTYRMVIEYTDRFYIPGSIRRNQLMANNREEALALAAWKAKVRQSWSKLKIVRVDSTQSENLPVGDMLEVTADIFLDGLTKEDVSIEVYYGLLDSAGKMAKGQALPLEYQEDAGDNIYRFRGCIPCVVTGQQGYSVRVLPKHKDLAHKHEMALITWG